MPAIRNLPASFSIPLPFFNANTIRRNKIYRIYDSLTSILQQFTASEFKKKQRYRVSPVKSP